jgi:hypothetical protein
MSLCCNDTTLTFTHQSETFWTGVKNREDTQVAIAATFTCVVGDLLKLDPATNTVTLATSLTDWAYISHMNITAQQSAAAIAASVGLNVIKGGEINIAAVKLNGVAVLAADYPALMASTATKNIKFEILGSDV